MKGHAGSALKSCLCELAELKGVVKNTKPRFLAVSGPKSAILITYGIATLKRLFYLPKNRPSTQSDPNLTPKVVVESYHRLRTDYVVIVPESIELTVSFCAAATAFFGGWRARHRRSVITGRERSLYVRWGDPA